MGLMRLCPRGVDMGVIHRCLRPALAAGLVGVTAHLLGCPDLLCLLSALAVVPLAYPEYAPRRLALPAPAATSQTGLDLGPVCAAPPQKASIWPGQRFRFALTELERHVAVVGATGSGKTTTLSRFIDAALEAGWPVLVVDAKGGRLVDVARSIGARHGGPVRVWLPGTPDSWTYDLCAGEATAVGNRLVGAFGYGLEGEVFHNLAQGMLPLVVRGLRSTDRGCDLDSLRSCLERDHLVGLARSVTDTALRDELLSMRDDALHRKALSGLVGRLRSLRHGYFGPWLLPSERTLDLGASLQTPGLTYLGLPATAASEDVVLVGRVLVQHLKQLAYAALWSSEPRPALIVFDEFVSLQEAAQLVDLLLQAREARLAVIVSTQQVPSKRALRGGVLGAGTLIVHQVGAEDARILSEALGSRKLLDFGSQLHTAPDGNVSIRRQLRFRDAYLISLDELCRLPVGQAAVSVRFGEQRTALVQVDPLPRI